jgi:hypothetical protein
MVRAMLALTPRDVRRIAAETLLDLRTIQKAYSGKPLRESTLLTIQTAAQKLELPPPPQKGKRA